MKLSDFGFDGEMRKHAEAMDLGGFQVGRIIEEQRDRYSLLAEAGEYDAEITGNLRFSAERSEDLPAVGDWVLASLLEHNFAVIHAILPRRSVLRRRALGTKGEAQIIAANVDGALLVQAADRDFNLNRLERYRIICAEAGVPSCVVITKTDLFPASYVEELARSVEARLPGAAVFAASNATQDGMEALGARLEAGKTYCLLGSSGVGKSSLINSLSGSALAKTGAISELTGKGRHVTSSRSLLVLESGAIIIDNPGMREVGMIDGEDGLEGAFDAIAALAKECRFADCTHTRESGCAVAEALEKGLLDKGLYNNYLKLRKEAEYFASTKAESHRKNREFGRMAKAYQKFQKKGRGD